MVTSNRLKQICGSFFATHFTIHINILQVCAHKIIRMQIDFVSIILVSTVKSRHSINLNNCAVSMQCKNTGNMVGGLHVEA